MAIEFGQRCGAGKTVLSHLDKSMDYASLCAEVPDNVLVGYDGLELVA
jgi:phosphoribosyl 1,2-cyclic phosphate phosphodiesterase